MKNLNPIVAKIDTLSPEEQTKMFNEDKEKCKVWALKMKIDANGNQVEDILSRKTYSPNMKDYIGHEEVDKSIYEAFSDYHAAIKEMDSNVTDPLERIEILKNVIGERETVDWLDDFLFKYISTRKYADEHGEKRKTQPLSENSPLSRRLSGLSNYILEHDEYKILSDEALENRSKKEIEMTYGDFEASKGQISINTVEGFVSAENQKDVKNKVLTKRVQLQQRKLTQSDFEHPEYGEYLQTLFNAREQLRMELGLHPSQSDEEKEVKKEQFFMKSADDLHKIKQHIFGYWLTGQNIIKCDPRVVFPSNSEATQIGFTPKDSGNYSDYQFGHIKSNLHTVRNINYTKVENIKEVELNAPPKEGEDIEKKFTKLAFYYGRPLNPSVHYGAMVKMINSLESEMFDIKERLRKPITFKKIAPTVSISRDMFEELDFVFANDVRTMLLTNQKGTEQYNQNYSMLKNQFEYKADSSEFWTLSEFDKAVNVGKESLDQIEIDIVDILMDKKRLDKKYFLDEDDILEDNILLITQRYIKLVHNKSMTTQEINKKIDTISKKIADEEARRQEIIRIKRLKTSGKPCKTIVCTTCHDELPPHEDYFNKDNRNGEFRKKCKKCVKNKK